MNNKIELIPSTPIPTTHMPSPVLTRGGSRPKLKGGQLGEGGQKHNEKLAPNARENFLGHYSRKLSGFLLNNALVYMFHCIQNESLKKECIRVRIRGAFLAKKGGAKAEFSS